MPQAKYLTHVFGAGVACESMCSSTYWTIHRVRSRTLLTTSQHKSQVCSYWMKICTKKEASPTFISKKYCKCAYVYLEIAPFSRLCETKFPQMSRNYVCAKAMYAFCLSYFICGINPGLKL